MRVSAGEKSVIDFWARCQPPMTDQASKESLFKNGAPRASARALTIFSREWAAVARSRGCQDDRGHSQAPVETCVPIYPIILDPVLDQGSEI